MPDEHEILDRVSNCHPVRDQDHPWTDLMLYEIPEPAWHRPHVVSDDYSAKRSAEFQHLKVFHSIRDYILRQFEIDLRLAEEETRYDLLIEVGVRQETGLSSSPWGRVFLGLVEPGCKRFRQLGLLRLHFPPQPFLILQERLDLVLVFERERDRAVIRTSGPAIGKARRIPSRDSPSWNAWMMLSSEIRVPAM
jgi:hypothetical protein